jgi:Mg-chelatase subunit ChlD
MFRTDDAWLDAGRAARGLECAALVVDTEAAPTATGRPRQLAIAMGASYARIEELDEASVVSLARAAS